MASFQAQPSRAVLSSVLRAQLASEGALELRALGASMMPTVPGGSLLRVVPLTRAPRRGELVAFVPAAGPLLCCHRVVATRDDEAVLTQGDRHDLPDGWAASGQIIGVVRGFSLGGKHFDLASEPHVRPGRYRIERQRLARACERLAARIPLRLLERVRSGARSTSNHEARARA